MPTISARRKLPVRGQPSALPVSASTSSTVRPCSCISSHGLGHDVDANAIGDEVRGVAGIDDRLAQATIGKIGDGGNGRRIGLRGGDDLEQPHVARRVEKVGAEPGAAELGGQLRGNAGYRQAAGIGGEDDSGLEEGGDFGEKFLLDGQVLGDCLDNPIAFGKKAQVMLEGSGLDQADVGRVVEGGRLGAAEGIERGVTAMPLPVSPAKSSSTTGMPALARWAAMRTPMVPAPSTAACWIIPGRACAGWAGEEATRSTAERRS